MNSDFLKMKNSDFPEFNKDGKGVLFLSPSWGGQSYHDLQSYSVDYCFPPLKECLKQLKLTTNLILYLPKNTDIKELVQLLSKMYAKYQKEVHIEIEEVIYKNKIKNLIVYTEGLARISSNEIGSYMEQNVFDVSFHKRKDKDYLKKLLRSLLNLKRAGLFIENFGVAKVPGGKKKNIA